MGGICRGLPAAMPSAILSSRITLNPCVFSCFSTPLRQEWINDMVDGIIIGMIGRFLPEKTPDRFLRVFRAVAGSLPGLRGVMIGDGPMLEDCRRLART